MGFLLCGRWCEDPIRAEQGDVQCCSYCVAAKHALTADEVHLMLAMDSIKPVFTIRKTTRGRREDSSTEKNRSPPVPQPAEVQDGLQPKIMEFQVTAQRNIPRFERCEQRG